MIDELSKLQAKIAYLSEKFRHLKDALLFWESLSADERKDFMEEIDEAIAHHTCDVEEWAHNRLLIADAAQKDREGMKGLVKPC